MIINRTQEGDVAVFTLDGRLDTSSSTVLSEMMTAFWSEAPADLILDFSRLTYVSSAGLRVLLASQKKANARNTKISVRNVGALVKEVFEITGFSGILTII